MKKLVILIVAVLVLAACQSNTNEVKKSTESSSPSDQSNTDIEDDAGQTEQVITGAPVANLSALAKDYASVPDYVIDDKTWRPIDFRQSDVSKLDLSNELDKLLHTQFDMKTIWPEKLPEKFDPKAIMDIARTPGLEINSLHKQGITGEDIGIAIIDQPLLVDHNEYKGKIKHYEEIKLFDESLEKGSFFDQASMHGPFMTSIAVGENCGVAPKANVYYFSGNVFNENNEKSWLAYKEAVDRVLEINDTLSEKNKIRVISISAAWQPGDIGYKELEESIQKAKDKGIFVMTAGVYTEYDYSMCYQGLDRNPLDSKENKESYNVIEWKQWLSMVQGFDTYYQKQFSENPPKEILLVPMDSMLAAEPTGVDQYVFERIGGWSSVEPYISGLYALACQVKPDITPELFWKTALTTGDDKNVEIENSTYKGKMINPVKLIENLKKQ